MNRFDFDKIRLLTKYHFDLDIAITNVSQELFAYDNTSAQYKRFSDFKQFVDGLVENRLTQMILSPEENDI